MIIRCFGTLKKASNLSKPLHASNSDMWETSNGVTPKVLTISMWNVNGIRSLIKKNALQQFMHREFCSDIICLNETKIDLKMYQKQRQSLHQALQEGNKEYLQYWNFCKISSGYSGVSMFAKYRPIRVIEDLPEYEQHSLQGRCLTLQYQKFFVVNCYKPNSGSTLERLDYRVDQYDRKFQQHVISLQKSKPVVVVGDLNVAHQQIDLANPKTNRNSAGFTDRQRQSFTLLLQRTCLVDSWRSLNPKKVQYSWWSYRMQARIRNVGWRIDYVLVDPRIKILQAQIHDQVMGSDHCPVSARIQLI